MEAFFAQTSDNFRGISNYFLLFSTHGNCSQTHFKVSILTFWKVDIFENWLKSRLEICKFIDLRTPPTTPWSMFLPQVLFLFWKKHAPRILEHVSYGFCWFLSIWGSHPPPRGLCASHSFFLFSEKTRPWIFGHAKSVKLDVNWCNLT